MHSNSLPWYSPGWSRKVTRKVYDTFFTKPMSYILSVAYAMCWLGQFIPVYIISNSCIEHPAALYIKQDEFLKSPDFWLFLTFGPCCHCIFCRLACSAHILSHCSLLPPSCLRAAYYPSWFIFSVDTLSTVFSDVYLPKAREEAASSTVSSQYTLNE